MKTSRREFIAVTAAGVFAGRRIFGVPDAGAAPVVRFGMVTDLHYADIDPDPALWSVVGRRFYRESLRKLDEAVSVFNARGLDFAIELGDFKDDTHGREGTLRHLDMIEAAFARFKGPRYHVAGNHDFDCLAPEEFFARVPNDGQVSQHGYYSFVRGGVTFIVLNACYDSQMKPYCRSNPWMDANVPPEELDWFSRELAAAPGNVIVFCHQRLEDSAEPRHLVRNADAVRALVEGCGKVKGVFTGHQHLGGFRILNGIPYYSLRALVCGTGAGFNSFAEVAVYPSGALTVTGWRNATSYGAKGEFPDRGLGVAWQDVAAKEAALVDVGAVTDAAALEARLAPFPKTGRILKIDCPTPDAALAVAETLKRTGRLAGSFVMTDSPKDLAALKTACPWVKAGVARWPDMKAAVQAGAEFLLIPPGAHMPSAEEMVYMHDRSVRTVCIGVDDETSARALVRAGHDFIVTSRYAQLRAVFS